MAIVQDAVLNVEVKGVPKAEREIARLVDAADGKYVKPGVRSTEFWVMLVLMVCVTTLISLDKITIDQALKLWPLFLGSSAYSLSRGIAKRG